MLNTERYFVVGEIQGDYDALIRLLYQQKFNFKDTLIASGNFINAESPKSLDCIKFIKETHTSYAVKGKNEDSFLKNEKPVWMKESPKSADFTKFLEELPSIIKISDYLFVVSAGIEPVKNLDKQDPEVFFEIGKFDKDSRFYQFDNPENKSWYDFDLNSIKICFSSIALPKPEVPAGYCLGRESGQPLKCLVLQKGNPIPVLVEGI